MDDRQRTEEWRGETGARQVTPTEENRGMSVRRGGGREEVDGGWRSGDDDGRITDEGKGATE